MKKRQVPFHKPSPRKKVAIHQNGTLSELEQHLTLISDNDQRDDGYDAAAADDDDGDDDEDDDDDGDDDDDDDDDADLAQKLAPNKIPHESHGSRWTRCRIFLLNFALKT